MKYDANGNGLTCFIDSLRFGLENESACEKRATHHVAYHGGRYGPERGLNGSPGPFPRFGQGFGHAIMNANAFNARSVSI